MKILGISEEHDSGAAIIDASGIFRAVNEERYTEIKFQRGFPIHSVQFLLKELQKYHQTINTDIAIASNFHVSEELGNWRKIWFPYVVLGELLSITQLDKYVLGSSLGPKIVSAVSQIQRFKRKKRISKALDQLRVSASTLHFFDHHTCHAVAAYYSSGWNSCLIITQDASGDGFCSKVFIGNNGQLEEKFSVPFFHSIGNYYEYVTLMLGYKLGQEGKVTALAASGNPEKTYPIFKQYIQFDHRRGHPVNYGSYRLPQLRKFQKQFHSYSREDIAAGVQKLLEEVMVQYILSVINRFSYQSPIKLVLSGGVFANVTLNKKISELKEVQSLFVFPQMGDGGLAAGAAYLLLAQKQKVQAKKLRTLYLGEEVRANEIRETFARYASDLKIEKPKVLEKRIAKFLANGKIVAVCRGRMEYGPRALGNRSILCSADKKNIVSFLNKTLRRSNFMPFAPVVQSHHADKYFKITESVSSCLSSMTISQDCSALCKKKAPAIVHNDGTARPQLVIKSANPFLYKVLSEYEKISGKHILINTSFNLHEKPIVRNADQAIQTVLSSGIDALILGDYFIQKR